MCGVANCFFRSSRERQSLDMEARVYQTQLWLHMVALNAVLLADGQTKNLARTAGTAPAEGHVFRLRATQNPARAGRSGGFLTDHTGSSTLGATCEISGIGTFATDCCRAGLPPYFLSDDLPEREFQESFRLERRHAFQTFLELLLAQSGAVFEVTRFAAPKVYGFDSGFVRALRGWTALRPDDLGQLREHFVLNEMHAVTQSREIRYWRDKRGHEVDFVWAKRGRAPLAIECKKSDVKVTFIGLRELHERLRQCGSAPM